MTNEEKAEHAIRGKKLSDSSMDAIISHLEGLNEPKEVKWFILIGVFADKLITSYKSLLEMDVNPDVFLNEARKERK